MYLPRIEFSTPITSEHVPKVRLCRFFGKREYSDSFMDGEYRFGNLKYYESSKSLSNFTLFWLLFDVANTGSLE